MSTRLHSLSGVRWTLPYLIPSSFAFDLPSQRNGFQLVLIWPTNRICLLTITFCRLLDVSAVWCSLLVRSTLCQSILYASYVVKTTFLRLPTFRLFSLVWLRVIEEPNPSLMQDVKSFALSYSVRPPPRRRIPITHMKSFHFAPHRASSEFMCQWVFLAFRGWFGIKIPCVAGNPAISDISRSDGAVHFIVLCGLAPRP